ncbi:hypothetical protein [Arthrobacter sp. UYEF36]|uniref:hypothetical protein n=1 Tax=Arthrobacter sp. UYEF36 TaxID=1756366 RepID=UPI00339557C2
MFTTTQGLAGSVSECRAAGTAAEGSGAGGVLGGAAAAGLSGRGPAEGVAVTEAVAVVPAVVADKGGEAAADAVGGASPGVQALRVARPEPASSSRLKARRLGAPGTAAGASGRSADPS